MREQLLARMRSLGSLAPPAEATACLEVRPRREAGQGGGLLHRALLCQHRLAR